MAKKRSCCCCFCIIASIILVLVAIAIAAFVLWARPPDIKFEGAIPPENQKDSFVLKDAPNFTFNLRLNITIDNPNYVGVVLKKIDGIGKLPINGEPELGSGHMEDVSIERKTKNTILFPVAVNYNVAEDKDLSIIKYIAQKCGLIEGQNRSKLQIKYTVTTSVKVVAVSVDLPPFNGDTDFDCPIPPGTKIPGLDLILQAANGKLPGNFNPQTLLAEAQKKLGNIDPSTLNNLQNTVGNNLSGVSQFLGN